MTPRADVLTRVEAVNLGLEQFADALRAQGAPVELVFDNAPGRIYHAKITAIPKGIGQGQVAVSGTLARTTALGGTTAFPALISIPDEMSRDSLRLGMSGNATAFAPNAGVIGLLAAIIVAVVLVLGFWKPGFFVTTKLDVNAAQTGVQQILTDEANGYGAKNVKDVKCNDGQSPTVKKGDTFNCEVSIDGTKRQVTVTFQDDSGTYEVGRPK